MRRAATSATDIGIWHRSTMRRASGVLVRLIELLAIKARTCASSPYVASGAFVRPCVSTYGRTMRGVRLGSCARGSWAMSLRQSGLELRDERRGERTRAPLYEHRHLVADEPDVARPLRRDGEDRRIADAHHEQDRLLELDDDLVHGPTVERRGRALGDAVQAGRDRRQPVGLDAIEPVRHR